MALVAERWGLIPELRQFAAEQRPIWGTCAGLIFLANRASGAWRKGSSVLGGELSCPSVASSSWPTVPRVRGEPSSKT